MQYDFLKHFPKRMKSVGLYAVLIQNSIQKTTWKQYGFLKSDEQINLIFAVLLYIMEQSLREDICTIDDIGAYIDTVNTQYFHKHLGYDECKELGDFIINHILCNEGKVMYFEGFDFEEQKSIPIHISYVANKTVFLEQDFRRTSYYLTDDGYNLLLSTLEIENNMKLTIHEMIFHMHLERQSYDKAVDEIKNIFHILHVQLQKIQEAMGKIRRNALSYSVRDYETILLENLDTIQNTKQKFQDYRQMVKSRVKELEEKNINVRQLLDTEREKLEYLREIERYLSRTIDEHQKILNGHFDLKALYTKELEQLSQMSLIQRFSLRTKLYDEVLKDADTLSGLHYFLRPLFNQDVSKVYNPNKAFQLQRLPRKRQEQDSLEELDFDEESWLLEKERARKEKLKKYEKSLSCLLCYVFNKGEATLAELAQNINEKEKEQLIPSVDIFKEIMVELLRSRTIDLAALQKERRDYIKDSSEDFQLYEMLLSLAEADKGKPIQRIEISRTEDKNVVTFANIQEEGQLRTIRCSDVHFHVYRKE